jgi:monoamine oxidase
MTAHNDFDAIVIGGGFAGLIAARDLADHSHSVVLLEARDRLGGRTWTRPFADTEHMIEMGGQWIEPQRQFNIVREIERYGIATSHSAEPHCYPTLLNGHRNAGPLPVPVEELVDLERAVFHMQKAASRIQQGVPLDQQGLHDLDVSCTEFFAPLNLPPATSEFIAAVFGLYGGRFPEEHSALGILAQLAHLDLSAIMLWGVLDVRFENGTKSLIDAMAEDCPDIRLSTPVASVSQNETGVTVTTTAGEVFTARTVIVATPVNMWSEIEFEPPLSEVKRETAADRHGTQTCGKFFALVRGGTEYPYLLAGPRSTDGLMVYAQECNLDGSQLMIGFICDPTNHDITTFEGVERALKTLDPDAELIKFDSHDWNTDPYSLGGWFSPRPGLLSRSQSELSRPEGRVLFASSDVAIAFQGWLEGAVETGHHAASTAIRTIAREDAMALVRR